MEGQPHPAQPAQPTRTTRRDWVGREIMLLIVGAGIAIVRMQDRIAVLWRLLFFGVCVGASVFLWFGGRLSSRHSEGTERIGLAGALSAATCLLYVATLLFWREVPSAWRWRFLVILFVLCNTSLVSLFVRTRLRRGQWTLVDAPVPVFTTSAGLSLLWLWMIAQRSDWASKPPMFIAMVAYWLMVGVLGFAWALSNDKAAKRAKAQESGGESAHPVENH